MNYPSANPDSFLLCLLIMKLQSQTKRIGLLVLLNILFFGLINPYDVNLVVLVFGLLLLLVSVYVVIIACLRFLRLHLGYTLKNERRLAVFTAAFIVSVLALGSIGQFTMRDFWVLVALFAVAYIYLSYLFGKAGVR